MERKNRKTNIIGIIILALFIPSGHARSMVNDISTSKNSKDYLSERGDFPIADSSGNQRYPAVAWGDTNYIVVWDDCVGSGGNIRGRRVSSSGDTLGQFIIPSTLSQQGNPAVAFDGTNYLVVWQDYRNGSDYDIYAQRVNPSGGLEGGNFAISTASDVQCWPAIAWDSINYLVVWHDCRSGGYVNADIYGQRVNSSGDTLGQFAISIATDAQQIPAIAWDGINYLVVWHDTRNGYPDIYGQRVNPSGGLVDSDFPISIAANDQCFSAIAWNGVNYLITWQDSRSSMFDWNIYGNLDVGQTGIEEVETENLHKLVEIKVYPNPFSQMTEIKYHVPEGVDSKQKSVVSIKIFDASGRLIKSFLLPTFNFSLTTSVVWDGTDKRW